MAIIPARGGSKRLPNKNMILLGGIPLIAHSINYAKENQIDKIVVSTDDDLIKEIALQYGAEVMDRPMALSTDNSPTIDTIKHVIENVAGNYDYLVVLQPTNPLRPKNLLQEAFKKIKEGNFDSLMTVTRNEQKFGKITNGKFEPYNYALGQRSQDVEPLYYENGLLYIAKPSLILEGKLLGENHVPFIVNNPYAKVDIDTQDDFEYAEYLFYRPTTNKQQPNNNQLKNPYIEIAGRKIGPDYPPLVIAEIGINHEGSIQIAKEMVDAAQRAGVEVVKHQTHIVEDEMSGAAKKVIPGNANVSIYEIMERCALDETDELELKNYVESKGMIFISTPFSRAAANRLESMNVAAYKIGSGECNNYPLLEHIASFGKPVILSTGMNTIESIQKAVDIFDKHGVPIALLHTTNLYPTPIHLVRFGAMNELHEAFPNKVFGLSDHTLNNNACLGAVALGASILERHFTDTMQRTGPDIVCSMDEKACFDLIHSSKEVWQMRGGRKEPAIEEQVTIDFAFAAVCTIAPVKKGEKLSKVNIWVKRPGTGKILAQHFNDLIGKVALRDIGNDEQLDFSDFE
jgi:sialic acid synthase SpsE/CMP-N-acetylneuraminic acid synthetase